MAKHNNSGIFVSALLLLVHGVTSIDDDSMKTRVARHTAGFCPDGWYTYDDKCYYLSQDGRMTWESGDRRCREMASNLASIHSEEEQEFLNVLMYEARGPAWIGLRRVTGTNNFSWSDSSPLDFTDWADGEPDQEDWVSLDNVIPKWHANRPPLELDFICKRPKDPTLPRGPPYPNFCTEPAGWLKLRNSCYKVFTKSENSAPWMQAQSHCKSYGGNLVYVKHRAITTLLRLHLDGLDGPFWTGIKSTKNHRFTWLGTHPLVLSNWQSDQPRELKGRDACVAMNDEAQWMVRDCKERHPFVCEVTTKTLEAPTIKPLDVNMTCPNKSPRWHDLGGKYCYIIDVEAKLRWREALCRCTEAGGSLASFHSLTESWAVRHYFAHYGGPLHIGFRKNAQGSFVWSDGSAADFIRWSFQEPNRNSRHECVVVDADTSFWSVASCDNRHGFICSALKVPAESESESSNDASQGHEALIGPTAIAGIVMGILVLFIVSAISFYYFRTSGKRTSSDKAPYSSLSQ